MGPMLERTDTCMLGTDKQCRMPPYSETPDVARLETVAPAGFDHGHSSTATHPCSPRRGPTSLSEKTTSPSSAGSFRRKSELYCLIRLNGAWMLKFYGDATLTWLTSWRRILWNVDNLIVHHEPQLFKHDCFLGTGEQQFHFCLSLFPEYIYESEAKLTKPSPSRIWPGEVLNTVDADEDNGL